MAKNDKTGKRLERRVAQAYRDMGARKVEHDVELAGNQIDVYVEIAGPDGSLHRIAAEAKDRSKAVGKPIVNAFAAIVKLLCDERLIDEGMIVSAKGFTKQARDAAATYAIRLVEEADLNQMVGEAKAAGRTSPAEVSLPLPPEPYFAHPYPMPEHWTGRETEMDSLDAWLSADGPPMCSLIAMGGTGKSSLAWAWLQNRVLPRQEDLKRHPRHEART